VKNLIKNKI